MDRQRNICGNCLGLAFIDAVIPSTHAHGVSSQSLAFRCCSRSQPGREVLDVFSSGGPTASWFLAQERKKDKTARIWDAATGTQLAILSGHARSVKSAEFSPDGRRVLTTSADKTARIWDATTGKQLAVLYGLFVYPNEVFVGAATFSPDGQRVVTVDEDAAARVWDGMNGRELIKLGKNNGKWDIYFTQVAPICWGRSR